MRNQIHNQNSLNSTNSGYIKNPTSVQGSNKLTINEQLEKKWNLIKDAYCKKYPEITSEKLVWKTEKFGDFTAFLARKTKRGRPEVEIEIEQWQIPE